MKRSAMPARRPAKTTTPEELAANAEKRFAKLVQEGPIPDYRPGLGPCLIFIGAANSSGYGQFRYNGRNGYAHRYAWERVNDPIPDGLTIDHLCRVRKCVRLGHLEVVTQATNVRRAVEALDRCPSGHLYTEENAGRRKGRRCGICETATRERSEARRRKLKPGDPDPRVRYNQELVLSAVKRIIAGDVTIVQAAREIGCNDGYLGRRTWKTAKSAVMLRDSHLCAGCGRPAKDVQHRIRRGMGGAFDPNIAYGMPNLVALCRACHNIAESRDPEMRRRGLWLWSWQDPASAPVAYATPEGLEWLLLLPDGGRLAVPVPEPEAGAA